jgi:branched-chain amino acid transport system ATP-binding protein
LEETGLLAKANVRAGSLPLLDRKRLELARALATNPKVLLLDEIAGGLIDQECHTLVEEITRIRGRGVSIVWIGHVVHALLAVVDRLMTNAPLAAPMLAGGIEHWAIWKCEPAEIKDGRDLSQPP